MAILCRCNPAKPANLVMKAMHRENGYGGRRNQMVGPGLQLQSQIGRGREQRGNATEIEIAMIGVEMRCNQSHRKCLR